MPRPSSIIAFERLYLGALALTVLDLILFWSAKREAVLMSPQLQARPDLAPMVQTLSLVMAAALILLPLLFWWLVARRASVVGKWLVVITEAVGALLQVPALIALVGGNAHPAGSVAIQTVATVLAVAAAVMLFRRDAVEWLRDVDADDEIAA